MDYKDIVIDNDAIVNTAPEELPEEAHNIPQGEFKPKKIYEVERDVLENKDESVKVGEKQGTLNPNPGYGEDEETKPSIKTYPVKGEVEIDGGTFADQPGIRVERGPVNFVGGLFVKGKPVGTAEEGSDDSNVYRFSQNEVMTEEIAATLKSGDVLLVNNMAFVINKINSDHTWFRGFYTDGSVEGKVSVALLNWEDTGTKQLTITWNEVSGGGGTKLYHHDIYGDNIIDYIEIISTRSEPYLINGNFICDVGRQSNNQAILLIMYYCDINSIIYSLRHVELYNHDNKLLVSGEIFNTDIGLDTADSEDFTNCKDNVTEL